MLKKNIVAGFLLMQFVLNATTIASNSREVDVLAACKTDCPDSKTNAEAHECVERKAKIRPSFKKTKCWEVNEEYELRAKDSHIIKGN
jgi:hypothetical protein